MIVDIMSFVILVDLMLVYVGDTMKIKEITIDVKKSKNFQTYSCSEVITIEEGDDIAKIKQEAYDRCRIATMTQIELDEQLNKPINTVQKGKNNKGDTPLVDKILTKVTPLKGI